MPTTIGGAINLTPNVLRILDHFGLLPGVLEFESACFAGYKRPRLAAMAQGRIDMAHPRRRPSRRDIPHKYPGA